MSEDIKLTDEFQCYPFITIIIATLNDAKNLETSILSILNQKYPNLELIIIDGGSTDDSVSVIKNYDSYIKYWVSEKDSGIYNAWNKGLEASAGNWFSFLGAGDTFLQNAIFNYSSIIIKNPDCDFISSKVNIVNKEGKYVKCIGKAWEWSTFRKYMSCAHPGAFHSKKLFNEYGKFNENYLIAGDYEFLLRKKEKLKTVFLDCITVNMLSNGVSTSSLSVFSETLHAKYLNTQRNILILYIEMIYHISKYFVRKMIKL